MKDQWKEKYGTDIIEDFKKDLHGKMEEAIIALFSDPIDYDRYSLRKAMSGLGTNEDSLIEIITSSEVLKKIIERYKKNLTEI